MQAKDAIYIDNSLMTLDEQVELVVRLADEQIGLSLRRRAADKA
jgi:cytidylate kinase